MQSRKYCNQLDIGEDEDDAEAIGSKVSSLNDIVSHSLRKTVPLALHTSSGLCDRLGLQDSDTRPIK